MYFSIILHFKVPLFLVVLFSLLQYPKVGKVHLLLLRLLFSYLLQILHCYLFSILPLIVRECKIVSVEICQLLSKTVESICILIALLILALTSYSVINLFSLKLTSVFGRQKKNHSQMSAWLLLWYVYTRVHNFQEQARTISGFAHHFFTLWCKVFHPWHC